MHEHPSVSVFYDLRTDIVSGMYMNKEDSDNINEDTRSCTSTYKKLSYTSFPVHKCSFHTVFLLAIQQQLFTPKGYEFRLIMIYYKIKGIKEKCMNVLSA
jgi:hypothetical protein